MKRNVKIRKSAFNPEFEKYAFYEDDVVEVICWSDGSGALYVKDLNWASEEGTHKSRVAELKRKRNAINKALKILEQLEDPKLYIKGAYKAEEV